MSYRRIFLTVNPESGTLINPADGSSASMPSLYYGETAILCISFLDSGLNIYPLAGSDTFELAADNDFVHGSDPLMIYSGNDMVDIPGDWNNISRESGRISVRVNCMTDGFATKLGAAESIYFNLELKRYIAGSSSPSIMMISKAKGKNVVHLSENEPVPSDVNYYNAAQTDALLRAGRELQFSSDSINWHDEQVSTDAYWRERYPEGDWSVAIALPDGTQGEKGDKGDKGEQGDQGIAGITDFAICRGRLTLSSGNPVPSSDITAASTLYFTPYSGKQISLWNSTAWQLISFAEVSVSLSSCAASTNYDVFAYLSNGSLALELTVWTDATNRATSLISQDGVYVKSGDATRRYLGTIRTTATAGQCEDSASKRFVWNFYNQQDRHCAQSITYLTYSYSTAAWRVAAGDSSKGLFFVCGLATVVSPAVEITCKVSSGGYMYVGIMKNGSNYYNQRLDFTSWFTSFMAAPTQMTAGYNYIHVGELVGSGTETGNDWGLWGTIKN